MIYCNPYMLETHLYKIVCKDETINDTFYGHAAKIKPVRSKHKSNCKNNNRYRHLYAFINDHGGWNNWELKEIELFKFGHTGQLKDRLRELRSLPHATLNKHKK